MTVVRRPFTARGVIASTLIGTNPPRLSARRLVRVGELFGINAGTVRVALSRMVSTGELAKHERGYELVGELLSRREAQSEGRAALVGTWDHTWELVAVTATAGSAEARTSVRRALTHLRLGELREGVWVRPANLDPARSQAMWSELEGAIATFSSRPNDDPRVLASRLWDLEGWSGDATELIASTEKLASALTSAGGDDPHLLAPGFVESAAVLRLFTADPLLPAELEPNRWPAAELRTVYSEFDVAYRRLLLRWLEAS